MLPPYALLRQRLKAMIANKRQQGHDTDGLGRQLHELSDDYEVLNKFALQLAELPLRADWPYHEPHELQAIFDECSLPDDEQRRQWRASLTADTATRIDTAFKASLCGCMLGKPIEVNPTLATLRRAAEAVGDWPISDYIGEALLDELGLRHESWRDTTRGNIHQVAPDDDINYTLLGMLILEEYGQHFSANAVRELWLRHLPVGMTFGPERTVLAKAAIAAITEQAPDADQIDDWSGNWNPGDEYCGALIRVDAYGYACPGDPHLAATLAWRDAHFTHRRTGLYSAMYIAAALALAPVADSPMAIFKGALCYVPLRSRFHAIVADSIARIEASDNWLAAYESIHGAYGDYCHCQVYQEIGSLINAIHFSDNTAEAICRQVSQGNDTDSFGATCGAIAGLYFNDAAVLSPWLAPFNNTLHTSLAGFQERSIDRLALRMASLPGRLQDEREGRLTFERPPAQIIDYAKGI